VHQLALEGGEDTILNVAPPDGLTASASATIAGIGTTEPVVTHIGHAATAVAAFD
jgi:hypothetical protein